MQSETFGQELELPFITYWIKHRDLKRRVRRVEPSLIDVHGLLPLFDLLDGNRGTA
jgi:hypothetical protein